MPLDCMQKPKTAMSVPSRKSSKTEEENRGSCSKISREQRIAKKLQTLYQHTDFKGFHIDITKDVTLFYNNIIPFAHLFSSELLNASWFTISSIIVWARNEFILEQDRSIRDQRESALPSSPCDSSTGDISFEKAVLVVPLIASNDVHRSKEASDRQTLFWPCFPVCSHEEASRGQLFVFIESSIQNFIAQSISSIRKPHFSESTLQHIGNKITKFVQESRELVSRFGTVCLKAFNGRMQQTRNFYFRFLGCSAIFAARGKKL